LFERRVGELIPKGRHKGSGKSDEDSLDGGFVSVIGYVMNYVMEYGRKVLARILNIST